MSAIMFKYKCVNCNWEFISSGISDFSYGEFIMRSRSGYEAYLNANENLAFREVLQIIRNHNLTRGKNLSESGELAQQVFGIACDLSPNFERLYIEKPPICNQCGDSNNLSWGVLEPVRISNIPQVSNNVWSRMTGAQKETAVEEELRLQMNAQANQ